MTWCLWARLKFISEWCRQKILREQLVCKQLLCLQTGHFEQGGLQCSWRIFHALYPARLIHVFRSLPWADVTPFAESMHAVLMDFLESSLQHDTLDRPRVDVACLPAAVGGLSFPHVQRIALASRLASLAALHESEHVPTIVPDWVANERPQLIQQLQPFVNVPLDTMLSSLAPLPEGARASNLSKRIMRHCHSEAQTSLSQSLHVQRPILDWQVRRHGGAALPKQRQPLQCAWLESLPHSSSHCLSNACFRWALRDRLAIPDGIVGGLCQNLHGNTLEACNARLDTSGHHALTCSASMRVRRHNAFRDLLQQLSVSSGFQCMTEQRTVVPDSQEVRNPEALPRSIHTCDLHMIDQQGGELWLDVRIVSTKHTGDLQTQLKAAERQKLTEYGLTPSSSPDVHGRLIPCILDAHGMMSPEACEILSYLSPYD